MKIFWKNIEIDVALFVICRIFFTVYLFYKLGTVDKKINDLYISIPVSIFSQITDKRYVDYYQNITFSSDLVNLPQKKFLYNDYKSFCYCKSKYNTNYPIYDKNACLNLNDCSSNFFISNNISKLVELSIWNKKNIYYTQKRYNFFQGIKNGACDKIMDYKKCGYLNDLKTDFCIKNNEICPFNNISFYLHNLTSDIIMLYEDKKMDIFENYTMKDFFPNISIKYKDGIHQVINSSYLYDLAYDNNISFLTDIISNETMKNIKIDLALSHINNEDIKLNDEIIKETKVINNRKNIPNRYFYFIYIMHVLIIINFYLSLIYENDSLANSKIYGFIISFFINILLSGLAIKSCYCLYYFIKEPYEEDYLFNKEYYNELKKVKILINDFFTFYLLMQNGLILFIIKRIYSKCKCKFNFFKKNRRIQQFNERSVDIRNSQK